MYNCELYGRATDLHNHLQYDEENIRGPFHHFIAFISPVSGIEEELSTPKRKYLLVCLGIALNGLAIFTSICLLRKILSLTKYSECFSYGFEFASSVFEQVCINRFRISHHSGSIK